ncbi:MAG TPA: gamma-glutamyl-gamma-aminobutyrate hydrolase family protein [Candidatus Saccharimonadales bacterium]|nr:gamma-glutamyl-gamma-aminobutyrate hydrolase family protein [Candidatus Saccharimonadales bacterium]
MSREVSPVSAAEVHETLVEPGTVAILDAGGQYVDLVRKAVRRQGYREALLPIDSPIETLQDYGAIIMSGSPASTHAEDAPMPDPQLWESDVPYLGICYGMQAMARAFGGTVEKGLRREDGRTSTELDTTHPLFKSTKAKQTALFTHGDFVTELPDGVVALGGHDVTDGTHVYSAIARGNFVGVQFHPEVFEDTPEGYQIISNFLQNIAELRPDKELLAQQTAHMVASMRAELREKVADREVIAFVSGGVDSAVALAVAATEIAPEKLHAYYIDNGFMRDEDADVITMLQHAGIAVKKVEAADMFMNATMQAGDQTVGPLCEVLDSQQKRHIIGKTFIDVQSKLITELGLSEAMLLQGTNAADRIESGHSKGGNTAVIKTHHNQVQEVKDLEARGLLLEPLNELYKNEVREVGRFLGLPDDVVDRQPFPGPGLAIRVICHEESGLMTPPEGAEDIKTYVAERSGLAATLLPVRSVGVGGDERSHLSAVAVEGKADWRKLHELAQDLPSTFRGQLNRVIYALGDTPLDKAYTVPTLLQPDVLQQLRRADAITFDAMRRAGLMTHISQFPVVLLPLSFGEPGKRSIVLRPVTTSTFMVLQALMPKFGLPDGFVEDVAGRILKEVDGITQVFLDLTNKPPGTTEWE